MVNPKLIRTALLLAVLPVRPCAAFEPADPQLIPEARAVCDYLASIYGRQTLLGQNKFSEADKVQRATGKYPAIVSVDLSGWHKVRWSDPYRANLDKAVGQLIHFSRQRGGIASIEWHWANPLGDEGTYAASKHDFLPIDVGKVVTPGTREHERTIGELQRKADILARLAEARVPVLWRPLHEIDGGWFWWTDMEHPEHTAQLWRMMFDYLVHERQLHNLIWVYSAGLRTGPPGAGKDVEWIELRRRFYPGDGYVDIAGIDIYVNDWYGWQDYRQDGYLRAYEIMRQVAPGKMLALCECQGIPNPDILRRDGPRWLYCLPWYVGKQGWNPASWVEHCYQDDLFVSLEDLPKFPGPAEDPPRATEK